MREGIGGSVLFYIILIFLAIYIVFIGFIMNYSAAYRANNYIVTTLENYEGRASSPETSEQSLLAYLGSHNYYVENSNGKKLDIVCKTNKGGIYFTVTTYVQFKLPVIEANLRLKVKNDTKTIYGVSNCNETNYNRTGEI